MKWKELYNKFNHKMYSRITDIKVPINFEANFKNYYKDNKVFFTIFCVFVILMICLAFYTNIKNIFLAIAFTFFIFVCFFYNNTYTFSLNQQETKIKFGTKTYLIKHDDLLNIYLDKHRSKYFVFFPEYTINIIFKDNESQMILSLPTYLLSKSNIIKLFENIDCVELEQQKELEKQITERKNLIKSIAITVFLIFIAFLITGLVILAIQK